MRHGTGHGRFAATLGITATLLLVASCASTGVGSKARNSTGIVLVAGATGGTGQEAVKQAQSKGYAVRVLVRDEAKARALFGDRVAYVVGNVKEPKSLTAAVKGATFVISALGSNSMRDPENKPELIDFGGVKSLAEAAKKAGVRHFVLVSSMGVTDKDNRMNKMFDNIMTFKLAGEDALRASGVPYTVVRPGGLRDGAGGLKGIKVMQGDPKIQGQIPRADVAAVCVNALGRKEAFGKTFEIIGDESTAAVDWNRFFTGMAADVR